MVVRSSMTGLLPSRDRTAEPSGLETAARRYRDRPTLLVNLVAIALPDHWFKDIFMLPGGERSRWSRRTIPFQVRLGGCCWR